MTKVGRPVLLTTEPLDELRKMGQEAIARQHRQELVDFGKAQVAACVALDAFTGVAGLTKPDDWTRSRWNTRCVEAPLGEGEILYDPNAKRWEYISWGGTRRHVSTGEELAVRLVENDRQQEARRGLYGD